MGNRNGDCWRKDERSKVATAAYGEMEKGAGAVAFKAAGLGFRWPSRRPRRLM